MAFSNGASMAIKQCLLRSINTMKKFMKRKPQFRKNRNKKPYCLRSHRNLYSKMMS